MTSSKSNFAFRITRRQFPLKPAFAATVNKSQGSTLSHYGVYGGNFFGHGQAYVAVSRATGWDAFKILAEEEGLPYGTIINTFYEELLTE